MESPPGPASMEARHKQEPCDVKSLNPTAFPRNNSSTTAHAPTSARSTSATAPTTSPGGSPRNRTTARGRRPGGGYHVAGQGCVKFEFGVDHGRWKSMCGRGGEAEGYYLLTWQSEMGGQGAGWFRKLGICAHMPGGSVRDNVITAARWVVEGLS